MAFNRQQLRRLLALETAGELFVTGTATAGTGTTFTLDELIDSGADAGKYRDRWSFRVSDAAERRITIYAPTTGIETVHRAVSPIYAAADVIEIHRWAPTLLHQAINDGLARCVSEQWEQVTIQVDQREYDLSAITYLTAPRQVKGVYVKVGETEVNTDLQEVTWAKVFWDNGVPTLRIAPSFPLLTGYFLYVRLTKRYGPLNDETTTTVAIDEFWARAAIKAALYKILAFRVSPGKERNRYLEDRNLALTEFRRLSKLNQPKFPIRVLTSTPTFGPRHVS